MKIAMGFLAAALAAGCGDDKTSAPADQVVTGIVFDEGGERLPNVSVVLGSGTLGRLLPAATVQTSADGRFTANIPAKSGQILLVSASAEGYAETHQRTAVSGVGEISANLVLPFAEAMECVSGSCSGDGIVLSGLPEDVVARARVFDPSSEIEAFPGDFDAVEGERLISGGFVWVGLKGANGESLSTLETPARMDLEFHRSSWSSVVDVTAGNGQIDVPFYAFNEDLGTWKRENTAVLFAASGVKLTEADLAALKGGSYAQRVYARGEVGHFSYWNIDWPASDSSSTRVRFSPQATQATMTGETFSGRSTGMPGGSPEATGTTSANTSDPSVFCFNGPRSERSDEDIDQNGIVGESETGVLTVRADGKFYQIPKTRLSEVAGACGDPQGDITDVVLTDEDLMPVQLCTVSGVMNDLSGNPVVGSIVSANVSALASSVRSDLCGFDCVETSTTDVTGRFSLTIPVAGFTRVQGFGQVTPPTGSTGSFRSGKVRFEGCPTGDVSIVADKGADLYNLTITREDDLLTWDPPVSASKVFVTHSQQYLKWAVIGPLASPATYGVVPGAAVQDIPSSGNPPREALETGDLVRVFATEPGEGFYEKSYEGLEEL